MKCGRPGAPTAWCSITSSWGVIKRARSCKKPGNESGPEPVGVARNCRLPYNTKRARGALPALIRNLSPSQKTSILHSETFRSEDSSGKETSLPKSPPLRTGREGFPSSGSSLSKPPHVTGEPGTSLVPFGKETVMTDWAQKSKDGPCVHIPCPWTRTFYFQNTVPISGQRDGRPV